MTNFLLTPSTSGTDNLVSRDTLGNFTSNNITPDYTTTATAAGTTTLTVASTQQQFFTGATTQTVTLPVVSTLSLGLQFRIINLSSGDVTVQSSGGNTLQAMVQNSALVATVISLTGTDTTSWSWTYLPRNSLTIPLPVADGETGVATLTGLALGAGTSAFTGVTYVASTAWTPVLTFGGGSTGITYGTQTGTYSRVGNIITFIMNIVLTDKGSSTGSSVITGLPTVSSNLAVVPLDASVLTFTGNVVGRIASGASAITLDSFATTATRVVLTDTAFANNTTIQISGSYLV